ncbi:hypothetical protein [Geodermatophilus sabuli]|uniref:hypothetical protein n=1 Tax=Geodermatophilus sabuli TaxID=1564158 RepID=UPI000BE310D6|nr:hypothetical protein [Geodermatophilus sabuli]MBB3086244.1 hypothetical protein [Geodermatophilus sabuli]
MDVAITSRRRADTDHVVADVLQRGLCTVRQLEDEAAALARRLTPWLQAAIADARRGMSHAGSNWRPSSPDRRLSVQETSPVALR